MSFEEPQASAQQSGASAENGNRKRHILAFPLALLAFIGLILWMVLTPPGFWMKLRLVGYAICHQIPSHSLLDGEHFFPLCARCTGMYLGSLLGLAFAWVQGKRGQFPPLWVWFVFGLFFMLFALDGLNSVMGVLPGIKQVYPSQNWLRLATGLGMGLVMGSMLAAAFNQTIWAELSQKKLFNRPFIFAAMLGSAVLTGALLYFGPSLVKQALMILSVIGVLSMLSLIYSIPAALLIDGQNKIRTVKELALPLLLGFMVMSLQISLFIYLRFLLTGSLGPLNL
ncbi:MAG: DUF2085 domain-containing protein [Anaerolineaceae bacterium]|nr:DUF2085 domain-containing protein [Anaerolineaceae bacterium]